MPSAKGEILALAAFLGICLSVSAIGGVMTAAGVSDWYQTLAKPSFNPPDWVFAPVWTTLYVMMAVAGWRVWRHRHHGIATAPLTAFAVQLALNLAWTGLFFGLRLIGTAAAESAILLAAIILTARLFWRVDRVAGLLFLPYIVWVGFATVLTLAIWRLN